jgi:ubiquinone/menaquinone biosynthesis C-methylase UbiE
LLYGDVNAESRVVARRYIKSCNYTSILDIPCGFCTEFVGLQQDAIALQYYGVDISQGLVELANQKNLSVIQASIEEIPYPDSFVDLCYARHIFEHIISYEKALNELIRVANKEVIIIFSIIPSAKPNSIRLWNGIYFNHYNKASFETLTLVNQKVHRIAWQAINHQEIMLHIYLRQTGI